MIKFLNSNNSLYVLVKKPLLTNVFASLFFLSIIAVLNGCVKGGALTPATVPVITTNSFIMNATSNAAQSGGIITSKGGADIITVGVCYSSTNSTPTTSNSVTVDTTKQNASNTKYFTSNLTGLAPSTTYYVRAYASNSAGTAYGPTVKFTTSANLSSIVTNVSTLAGDQAGTIFSNPQGVVTDKAGNIYVADGFNNLIKKVTPAGVV